MNNLQCYQQQKRERKGRQFDKGTSPKQYSPRDKSFKVEVFLVIIDKLSWALQHRLGPYKDIHEKFGFLTNLSELSNFAIRWAAAKIMEEYSSDFEDCLPSELVQFSKLFKKVIVQAQGKEKEVPQCQTQNTCTELNILLLLNELNFTQLFTNVHIALLIYLSMMTSNCNWEQSFSKLKRI